MEIKELQMDLAGRTLKVTNGPIQSGADGYAIISLGETVVLGNASISPQGKPGADFFPMVVDYEENMYAAGKISGSRFIKRSGRPSERAILNSRLIDRPIRPLFPKGTTNEVQIICSVLSADLEVDPATTAMNAASMALLLSGAPFEGPIGAVRIGYHNDKLIVNPTYQECEEGRLNLIVAGTIDAITMVEAAASEIEEETMLEALDLAHKYIREICEFQLKYAAQFQINKIEAEIAQGNQAAKDAVKGYITEAMLDSIKGTSKKAVGYTIKTIEDSLFEAHSTEIADGLYGKSELASELNTLIEKNMRKKILEKEERIDGRRIDEIRPISVYTDILPRVHGSAIFQRGETMSLTITTLGSPGDAQIVDTMEADASKRYFHHYQFPPYATGDIKMLRGPSRREIGHGDLAERALLPVLPSESEFPYTIWVVSEIVKCNGSSSMASVCGSTLSLMAAGVPIKKPVTGIAMGLVMDSETGTYRILSDIQGLEDFAGDMDFKVTGTDDGITALQMDIKVKGLSLDLLREALTQAKQGRDFIMGKMLEVISEPRKELSKHAPLIMSYQINPDDIRTIIGKGGETIQKITAECNVQMDIDDDGNISITAPSQEEGQCAIKWIKSLTTKPEVGTVYDAKVVKLMEFGAFVEFLPGKQGLCHISQLGNERVNKVTDVVNMGDTLKVKLVEIDREGRYNLSHKAAMAEQGGHSKAPATKSDSPAVSEHDKEATDPNSDITRNVYGHQGKGEIVEGTNSVRKVNGA
ncbi:polyribonucleotide nucleotidyltransferase [Candidatus Peregrinibacteria bacterium HGW-Peregrinibacteria-1]|jgi:polyribonucleotide nucleotidyltransferase|nr:MAG: polyribonucleotide nucleotidyltransferase [Candidatus Peregrinibacteria bacterium HGW-Peregrinibacteria-1]